MIRVQNVSKTFGKTVAVVDASFEIAEGETLVLLGTSGSGKTTLLKMINRLISPSSGRIFVNGKDTATIAPEQLRRNMGYVIQHMGLFPHYTVAENIAVVPQLLDWTSSQITDRTNYLLEKMGLAPAEFSHKYPHQLSGGQQQRVGLARALAANPAVILMDEPFGALDPITRHSIRQEFLRLDELSGKTTVLVTHDVQEAILLGDRICLMDTGIIQQIGSPRELLFSPANAFVDSFFAQNRFQLQLMVSTLADVLAHLPKHTGYTVPENTRLFDAKANLWEVLEQIQHQPGRESLVGIEQKEFVRYVTVAELLVASKASGTIP